MKHSTMPVRITAAYAFFGALWILLSDKALNLLPEDIELYSLLQTYKGWLFIAATAALLFFLIRRETRAVEKKEREKQELFAATVSAMNHILNNFLNQMMIFRTQAEDSADFDEEIIDLYDQVIEEANGKIRDLTELKTPSPEKISDTLFGSRPDS